MSPNYQERFRPRFHFSPQQNWKNDPHGLIYHADEYHLFYQHHAHDSVWGPMCWGHAVSADRVTWQHLPIAISPDQIGGIWTGCVVDDRRNTSGFSADGALVAVYSYEDQSVGLAYSTDRGRTWQRYPGNPVIPSPGGNFRDPQVFWWEESQRWHMAISCEQSIHFFASVDLRDWQKTGEFTAAMGKDAPWEVPDIFHFDLGEQRHWVLLVSMNGALAGGLGVRYFIGEFDGQTFHTQDELAEDGWLDFGPDNYAGSTWKDTPDSRRVYLAWMNDWRYAESVPTQVWRGAATIPRELELVETAQGFRIIQRPLSELKQLRGNKNQWRHTSIAAGENLIADIRGNQYELCLQLRPRAATEVGLHVLKGCNCELDIRYHTQQETLSVNRMNSGQVGFHGDFPAIASSKINLLGETLSLQIFVDHSLVEVFANQGEAVISMQVFPDEDGEGLAVYARGGDAWLESMDFWRMKSIWETVD